MARVTKFAGVAPICVGRVPAKLDGKVTLAFTVPLIGTDAPVTVAGKLLTPTVPVTDSGIELTLLTGAAPAPVAFFCGTRDITNPSAPKPRVTNNSFANRLIFFLLRSSGLNIEVDSRLRV